jgi:hypothetical protein
VETRHYLGNDNLKDQNVSITWTPDRLSKLSKCKKDPVYFITNYVQVVTLDSGVTPFKLWDFQVKLVNTVHEERFVITVMPRQSGKSSVMVAYFLHHILFNEHKRVGILANKRETAVELLSRLQLAFELLPMWLQQGVKVWNKTRIELENGCIVEAHATSGASVRGKTFNIIFLDEFAHIESKLADKFWTSTFPVISSGKTSKVIIVSTPNGMNLFAEIWHKAILDKTHKDYNNFVPIEVHYTEVPGREKPEWAENMVRLLGSQEKFDQEFGNEFLGSSSTLLSRAFLRTMISLSPTHSQAGLDVYEDPKVDVDPETGLKTPHAYVICVDAARGMRLDYHAFSVIDVSASPYKLVAKYRRNDIPVPVYADMIVPVAKRYNNAFILVEVDGPGHQVSDDLHHIHEYENILMVATKGRSGQILATGFGNTGKNVQRGLKMSTPVRRTGCSNLKTLLENKRLITFDADVKAELSTFELRGEKYEAAEGKHDDLVMTLVSFAWLTTQKYFRDMMEAKVRQSFAEEYSNYFEHDLTPYGYILDHVNTVEQVVTPSDVWYSTQNQVWERFAEREKHRATMDIDRLKRLQEHGWS